MNDRRKGEKRVCVWKARFVRIIRMPFFSRLIEHGAYQFVFPSITNPLPTNAVHLSAA
jgi:hypothetical protein